ncbi:MAG: MFS transporter [Synergistaceae bacterium]|nr:MFS transporter [Synergistaceae bacterium]MDD2247526.1 MFS transporter [Proteiniphilum sp.]
MYKNNKLILLLPVIFTFFTMGFVDLVGIATNYIKNDFELSDTMANLMPAMVFFWFFIFSVPTGMLMNKIGRRKTVLLSLVVTLLSLLIPMINYSFPTMLVAFSFLGIGNTLMQVSLNPLVSNIVSGERLASSLTFGQFVKAIASFVAPIIAAWALIKFGDWKLLFLIFAVVAVLAAIWLFFTKIEEKPVEGKQSTFAECFALLGDKTILLLFLGIMAHVGTDVGVNTTAPKLLIERLGMPLSEAGYATSVYFLFRTIGSFSGAFILARFSSKSFFWISILMMLVAVVALYFSYSAMAIYVCIALIGFGNSNVFSIMFSQALQHLPQRSNEISGLMIMGLAGGAVFPLLMGILSDAMGSQIGAVIVLTFLVAYFLLLAPKIESKRNRPQPL